MSGSSQPRSPGSGLTGSSRRCRRSPLCSTASPQCSRTTHRRCTAGQQGQRHGSAGERASKPSVSWHVARAVWQGTCKGSRLLRTEPQSPVGSPWNWRLHVSSGLPAQQSPSATQSSSALEQEVALQAGRHGAGRQGVIAYVWWAWQTCGWSCSSEVSAISKH